MAKFSKLEVLNIAINQGMVPLFYHEDAAICKELVRACYEGGSRILEFTNRGDKAYQNFTELVQFCRKELPELAIGVGSITDGATAAMFIQAGADFIVSPALREDIVLICNRRKVPFMPGCASLTEIGKAEELGCDIVKLFPGSVYGPGFVKAIRGPQPWTSIMPTGGVSAEKENLKSWFDAGVVCVGMGSKLISKAVIQNKDYTGLTEKTSEVLSLIQQLRNQT